MDNIIKGLKSLSFKHPEMEQVRLLLIEAFENRQCIPSKKIDLWVLNHVVPVVPHSLSQEDFDEISKWVKETENEPQEEKMEEFENNAEAEEFHEDESEGDNSDDDFFDESDNPTDDSEI
jgi:ubiquinone/menaquinone biosynthesis C-methylase UbiE